MKVDGVIVAAGGSRRFGGDKLFVELRGVSVLGRSIAALAAASSVERIVIVAGAGSEERARAEAECHGAGKVVAVVTGGERRRDSVEAGLRVCRSRYVAIQDGARPLVTAELVELVVTAADGKPGAIAAMPVSDTIKEVRERTIMGHPDRANLWAAQTPQVVLRQAWFDAAARGDGDETDDAAMLARLGLECVVVEGDVGNIKITRPIDLKIAEAIIDSRFTISDSRSGAQA